MALSANQDVDRFVDQDLRSYSVGGGVHVYRGAFVEVNASGFAVPLTASGVFVGLAYEEADNSSGQDGDVNVRVFTQGDFSVALVGATEADIGRAVYASDDNTVAFSAQLTARVGYVAAVESAGRIVLRLAPQFPVNDSRLEHHATSFSVPLGQSGTTYTNLAASGVVTATLPGSAPAGTTFGFVCMADQPLQVAPAVTGSIYIKGARQAAGKYASIGDIGDFIHLVADGTGDWVAISSIGGADIDITIEP